MQKYYGVSFRKYVVGEPNKITVSVEFEKIMNIKNLLKKVSFYDENIDLISYNEVNPQVIKMDIHHLMRKGRVSYGDLSNILPPGLEIHPKYSKRLDSTIAYLEEFGSKRIQDLIYTVLNGEILRPKLAQAKTKQKAPKKKKAAQTRPSKSIKKIIKGE